MSKHGPGDDVPDRINGARRRRRPEVAVGRDAPALVQGHPGGLQVQPAEEGAAAGRDEHDVGLELLGGSALGGLEGEDDPSRSGPPRGRHLGVELELEALFGQRALEGLPDLAVHRGDDVGEELYDGDLGAEAGPDGALEVEFLSLSNVLKSFVFFFFSSVLFFFSSLSLSSRLGTLFDRLFSLPLFYHLQSDVPPTDNDQRLRHLLQLEGPRR